MNYGYIPFIVIPAVMAAILPFAAKKNAKFADIGAIVALAAGLAAAIFIIPQKMTMGQFTMTFSFGADISWFDPFTHLMVVAIFLVGFLVAAFSSSFVKEEKRRGLYFSLILLAASAAAGLVSSRDFFTLFVFMEVLAVCSFALIAFDNDALSTEGALKYFFISAPATVFVLFAVALLMLGAGGVSFAHLGTLAVSNPNTALIVCGLFLCAFMLKSGLVPFHAWTPDAYQSAPAPVSAYMAGIITKAAGVYVLVRLSFLLKLMSGNGVNVLGNALMFIGAASIVVGALAALTQKDFKRIFAYSSISQLGYIALAAGLGTPLAMAGAIFHIFNHATFKTVLFLNGAIIERGTGTRDISKLGGLEGKMPVTSWTSVIATMSTAGIPPLSGFWSKLIIISALWIAGARGYAVLALLASVLTLAYFLVFQRAVFFGKMSEKISEVKEAPAGLIIPVAVMTAVIVFAGLCFPVIYSAFAKPGALLGFL